MRRNKEWKPESQKRNVAKLGDEHYKQLFECRLKEIMPDNNNDLWGSFKESVQEACDEERGYKKSQKCNVDTWWWNSGVKDDVQWKKKHLRNLTQSH